MKLGTCAGYNFGSYKKISVYLTAKGLSLVHGPTGVGKSTLFDLPCWIMFGFTAKDGNADEVRNWGSKEPTQGVLEVHTNEGIIIISRIRGTPSQNDLCWLESNGVEHRGADIKDTQKRLTERLGFDRNLYVNSAYFSEFSSSHMFFLNSSKDRRKMMNDVLSFPLVNKLMERLPIAKKETKDTMAKLEVEISRIYGQLESEQRFLDNRVKNCLAWEIDKKANLKVLQEKHDNFEQDTRDFVSQLRDKWMYFEEDRTSKIKTLEISLHSCEHDWAVLDYKVEESTEPTTLSCPTCGKEQKNLEQIKLINERDRLSSKLDTINADIHRCKNERNVYKEQIEFETSKKNHYFDQIETLKDSKNPHESEIDTQKSRIKELSNILAVDNTEHQMNKYKLSSLSELQDLTLQLRGHITKTLVSQLQDETNRCLDIHFDSEFRVSFQVNEGDDLEVSINKGGQQCVYTQLSKGQRSLLNLCFSVAFMKASANHSGTKFSTLFFDEALDGLDSTLKVKAFNLFQELEKDHDTILLIDHAEEFKTLFSHSIEVTTEDGHSVINE